MKIIYFDCSMGAAGDMLCASLLDNLEKEQVRSVLDTVNNSNIPNVKVEVEEREKSGIVGKGLRVLINHEGKTLEEDDSVCGYSQVKNSQKEEDIHEHHDHHHDHEHHEHHDHHHEHEHHHDHDHHDHHDHHHEHEHHHDHDHHHDHSHNSLKNINQIIQSLNLKENIKDDIANVYKIIAQAESKAHNQSVENIHFHEVGTMDALADIATFCTAVDFISPDMIISSAVNTGKGQVHCAHGILPVPAPATANILLSVPSYSDDIEGELCTPTGAALLKYFVDRFEDMPLIRALSVGYGMGKKDFKRANCLRAFIAQMDSLEDEKVFELSFNIDDMTSEDLSFATEMFFENGALEVFVTPVTMKKSRPGFLVTLICTADKRETMVREIFKNTSTIGIREQVKKRYTLERKFEDIQTNYGKVTKKISEGYGVKREKYEYDDISEIARKNKLGIQEIRKHLNTL